MDYKPYRATLNLLFDTAFGRCVDVGSGSGASYAILEFCGDSVVGLENNIDYLQPFAIYVPEILEEQVQGFDYGFIDHFPLEQRWTVAEWMLKCGMEIVVDDAHLLSPHPEFHRHLSAYHYAPKGCTYVDAPVS